MFAAMTSFNEAIMGRLELNLSFEVKQSFILNRFGFSVIGRNFDSR